MLTHRTSLRGGITHRNGEVLRACSTTCKASYQPWRTILSWMRPGSQVNLPFALRLGLVGYLGYEVTRDRGLPRRDVGEIAPEPDAAFIKMRPRRCDSGQCVWILELQQVALTTTARGD